MNISILSSVLSSSIFLSSKSVVFSSFYLTSNVFKTCFKTRKLCFGVDKTLAEVFALSEKKYLCSEQLKQSFSFE